MYGGYSRVGAIILFLMMLTAEIVLTTLNLIKVFLLDEFLSPIDSFVIGFFIINFFIIVAVYSDVEPPWSPTTAFLRLFVTLLYTFIMTLFIGTYFFEHFGLTNSISLLILISIAAIITLFTYKIVKLNAEYKNKKRYKTFKNKQLENYKESFRWTSLKNEIPNILMNYIRYNEKNEGIIKMKYLPEALIDEGIEFCRFIKNGEEFILKGYEKDIFINYTHVFTWLDSKREIPYEIIKFIESKDVNYGLIEGIWIPASLKRRRIALCEYYYTEDDLILKGYKKKRK